MSFAARPEKVDRVRPSAAQAETRDEGQRGWFSLSRLIQQAAARKRLEKTDDQTPRPGSVQKVLASPCAMVMNEWEAYEMAEVTKETVECLGGPLDRWQQNELLYPHIVKLARKNLAAQASSAASERLFSQAGLVVTSNRNSM